MNTLSITPIGRERIAEYMTLKRKLLTQLDYAEGMQLLDLVQDIRTTYHEYKHVNIAIFTKAIAELIQDGMVERNIYE